MRHSPLDLTMNVYADPTLLDVAGALEFREGVQEEDVIGRLRAKLSIFVRVKRSLDRAGLKAAVLAGEVKREGLEGLGLELIEHEEAWAVKPDHRAVRKAVGKA